MDMHVFEVMHSLLEVQQQVRSLFLDYQCLSPCVCIHSFELCFSAGQGRRPKQSKTYC